MKSSPLNTAILTMVDNPWFLPEAFAAQGETWAYTAIVSAAATLCGGGDISDRRERKALNAAWCTAHRITTTLSGCSTIKSRRVPYRVAKSTP